jgi:hypothetical protein
MKLFSVCKTLPPLLLVALSIAGCSGGVVTGLQNYYGHPADVTPPWLNASPEDVCVWGDYAYVAAGANGVHIYDISNPSNPVWVYWVETGGAVRDIDADDRYVYAMGEGKFYVINKSAPQSAYIVAEIDIPGYSHAMAVEGSYAFITAWYEGLQIVDLSVPEYPRLISSLDIEGTSTYIVVEGDYAVIAACNYDDSPLYQHLKIIDIKDKGAPFLVGDAAFSHYLSAIEINNKFVYWGDDHGLHVLDISTPTSPHNVYDVDSINVYSIAVSGKYLYVSGFEGELPYKNNVFRAFDITNPAQPGLMYSRNVDAICRHMDIGKSYAFMACMWWGLKVIDTNPSSPSGVVYSGHTPPRGLTNFTVDSGYAYFVVDDLQIFKVSPPESACYIMTLAAPEPLKGVDIKGGYAYAVHEKGMCIIDVDPPERANIVKNLTLASGEDVTVNEDYAYIMGPDAIIQIVDINPVDAAHLVGAAGPPTTYYYNPRDIAVDNGYAYVAYSYFFEPMCEALSVFDVDPPESVHFVCYAPGDSSKVVAGNGYAFTWVDDGLAVIEMTSSQEAQLYKTIEVQKQMAVRALDDGYLYSTHDEGFTILDVDPVESARPVWDFIIPAYIYALDVDDGYVYLSTDELGLRIIRF